jgi:hypothetical protein
MNLSLRRLQYRHQASSALVIVLFVVVLVTLMILALMTGAKFERQSAFYYKERVRADALAQGGVEQAIGLLRTAMGSTTNGWVSGPGLMVSTTYNTNNGTFSIGSPFPLSSGTNIVTPTGVWAPANLNSQMLDGTYPLDGGGSQMLVRWIYVHRDGTLDTSDQPAYNAANPLVGRYAFWIDDSSSRINLNTAYQRANNTNAPSDVSRIDLTTIPAFAAGTVTSDTHAYATNNPFNSDYDLRTNEIYSAATANRYAYTFYNHSSDGLNPFGKPKIYLTTQIANLPPGFTNVPNYTNYFFSILTNNGSGVYPPTYSDPGIVNNLSDGNIGRVVDNVYSYLTNTAWPEAPGTSFAAKFWHSNTDPRIFQLAVNIVEYVRAAESKQEIMPAIRGNVLGTANNYYFSSTTVLGPTTTQSGSQYYQSLNPSQTQYPLVGITRSPVIDELGMYYQTEYAYAGQPYLMMQAEIYLPPNCGIDCLNAYDISMCYQFDVSPNTTGNSSDRYWGMNWGWPVNNWGGTAQQAEGDIYNIYPTTFPLNATNRYAQVQFAQGPSHTGWSLYTTETNYLWAAISPNSQGTCVSSCAGMDSFQTAAATNSPAVGPFIMTTNNIYPPTNFPTYQVDDPLAGVNSANWTLTNATWSAFNTNVSVGHSGNVGNTPLAPSGSAPYQDLDSTGKVTSIGWRMPYPYLFFCTNTDGTFTIKNTTGRVNSLAELGYIATGATDWTGTGGTDGKGVPYRTLHLQPSKNATPPVLPDWALLDLFALPPAQIATNFTYQPYGWTNAGYNGIGGRLNLNGQLPPFNTTTASTNAAGVSLPTRATPLMAMLSGATNSSASNSISFATAGTLATNILNMTTSTGTLGTGANKIVLKGQLYDSTNGLYAHIGELAEVQGVADGGEASEGNLFEPLAQTTVGGNVFTIYTVGQALQQTASGTIIVNGEKRYQATVERIPTVPASQTSGLFRYVGERELNP